MKAKFTFFNATLDPLKRKREMSKFPLYVAVKLAKFLPSNVTLKNEKLLFETRNFKIENAKMRCEIFFETKIRLPQNC